MKQFSLVLATILTASGLSAGEEREVLPVQEQVVVQPRLGKESIASLRAAYERGDYDSFLEEMNRSYLSAFEQNRLAPLAQLRAGPVADLKWLDEAKLLQAERNRELVRVVTGQETPLASRVRSATAALSSENQEQAIAYILQLRQLMPGSGKNSDENALIDLDIEYEYKATHLEMPGQDMQNRRERHYVLKMDYLDKMRTMAEVFDDAELKQRVELFSQRFDERLAQNWDQTDLMTLMRAQPANKSEEEVVAILKNHQEKLGQLTKQHFAEASHAAKK